mmetsp:Transcript_12491/g.17080  ORF Transcript_12491/g.17080 Transcript_12491/m.17080 type:complete len:111 (+) Transcript_12491:142-474(+)
MEGGQRVQVMVVRYMDGCHPFLNELILLAIIPYYLPEGGDTDRQGSISYISLTCSLCRYGMVCTSPSASWRSLTSSGTARDGTCPPHTAAHPIHSFIHPVSQIANRQVSE